MLLLLLLLLFCFVCLFVCLFFFFFLLFSFFFKSVKDDVYFFFQFQKRVVNVYRLDTGKLVLKQQIHLLSHPIAFLHYECTDIDCALVRTIQDELKE